MRLGQFLNNTPDTHETPETEVRRSMEQAGIDPMDIPATFDTDGAIHRFPIRSKGTHNENGWYVMFRNPDGTIGGSFSDWANPDTSRDFKTGGASRELTPDEQQAFNRKMEEAKKQAEQERQKMQEAVASTCRTIYASLKDADDGNAYLQKKHVHAYPGVKQTDDGRLVIPLLSGDLKIVSLQYIAGDSTKRFQSGGRKKGCFFPIGEDKEGTGKAYLCEGYATGASIHEATGKPVYVAFDCGNLEAVAGVLKDRRGMVTVVADNDESGAGQKGAGQACKLLGGFPIIIPRTDSDQSGFDANDYAQKYGVENLKGLLTADSFFTNVSEFLKQPMPQKSVIKGWFNEGAFVMLYGDPGAGKTFVAIDWMFSIACGIPWHGYKTQQMKVAYLCGEGRQGLSARFTAWVTEHQGLKPGDGSICVTNTTFDLDDTTSFQRVIGELRERFGQSSVFVVIDTLNRFFRGDENKAQDIRLLTNNCKRMTDELGYTVVIVHHSRKNKDFDNGNNSRGSSALLGALDTSVCVESHQGKTERTITQDKQKDQELLPPLTYTLKQVTLPGWKDEYGDDVTSAVVEMLEGQQQTGEIVARPRSKADMKDEACRALMVEAVATAGDGLSMDEKAFRAFLMDRKHFSPSKANNACRGAVTPTQGNILAYGVYKGWWSWKGDIITLLRKEDTDKVSILRMTYKMAEKADCKSCKT